MISTRVVLLNGLQLVCHPHSVAMFATLPLHARVVLRDVHVLLMLCVHLHVALGLQCVMCINLIQVMFVHLVSVLHHFVILITRQVAYTHIDKVRTWNARHARVGLEDIVGVEVFRNWMLAEVWVGDVAVRAEWGRRGLVGRLATFVWFAMDLCGLFVLFWPGVALALYVCLRSALRLAVGSWLGRRVWKCVLMRINAAIVLLLFVCICVWILSLGFGLFGLRVPTGVVKRRLVKMPLPV